MSSSLFAAKKDRNPQLQCKISLSRREKWTKWSSFPTVWVTWTWSALQYWVQLVLVSQKKSLEIHGRTWRLGRAVLFCHLQTVRSWWLTYTWGMFLIVWDSNLIFPNPVALPTPYPTMHTYFPENGLNLISVLISLDKSFLCVSISTLLK